MEENHPQQNSKYGDQISTKGVFPPKANNKTPK
jgi:hypothetical protein